MMKIHTIFSVRQDIDGALIFDMDFTGGEGRRRSTVVYRATDIYGAITPIITQWLADNNPEIMPYVSLQQEPKMPVSIPAVTFWERTTEAECIAIEAMLAQQPFRVRQIFVTAQSYRSDHELWPLLQSTAIGLFGEARAAELLKCPQSYQ